MDTGFIEYCIKIGVFSKDTLNNVLPQIRDGVSIYEVLTRAKLISQDKLAVIAGEFYHAPVVDLSKLKPEPKAVAYGSPVDCKRLQFIPFGVDSAVGLLVAVADYAEINAVKAYLQTLRVDKMKFYIAPFVTLHKVIELAYEQSDPDNLSFASKLKRNASLLKTQAAELDLSVEKNSKKIPKQSAARDIDLRRLQALTLELAECRDENLVLRQRIEQLSATIDLEAKMIRELAKILNNNGILDDRSFEQWLLSQR